MLTTPLELVSQLGTTKIREQADLAWQEALDERAKAFAHVCDKECRKYGYDDGKYYNIEHFLRVYGITTSDTKGEKLLAPGSPLRGRSFGELMLDMRKYGLKNRTGIIDSLMLPPDLDYTSAARGVSEVFRELRAKSCQEFSEPYSRDEIRDATLFSLDFHNGDDLNGILSEDSQLFSPWVESKNSQTLVSLPSKSWDYRRKMSVVGADILAGMLHVPQSSMAVLGVCEALKRREPIDSSRHIGSQMLSRFVNFIDMIRDPFLVLGPDIGWEIANSNIKFPTGTPQLSPNDLKVVLDRDLCLTLSHFQKYADYPHRLLTTSTVALQELVNTVIPELRSAVLSRQSLQPFPAL